MSIARYVMLALFSSTLVFATIFGESFLKRSLRFRLFVGLSFAALFGGWIAAMNLGLL